MTMTEPQTIVSFDAEDLEHVEYIRNLLVRLDQQVDDFRQEGFDFSYDFSDERFTRKTIDLLDEIQNLWEQING